MFKGKFFLPRGQYVRECCPIGALRSGSDRCGHVGLKRPITTTCASPCNDYLSKSGSGWGSRKESDCSGSSLTTLAIFQACVSTSSSDSDLSAQQHTHCDYANRLVKVSQAGGEQWRVDLCGGAKPIEESMRAADQDRRRNARSKLETIVRLRQSRAVDAQKTALFGRCLGAKDVCVDQKKSSCNPEVHGCIMNELCSKEQLMTW